MPLKNIRVLLVEDDELKLMAVKEFVETTYGLDEIEVARSYASAMRALDSNPFDLALLDMSLPTYDLANDREGGGEPQGFGGQDLMRTLEADFPCTKAIVITQYNSFQDPLTDQSKSFTQLVSELHAEFGEFFLGMISYSGKLGRWKSELRIIIEKEFQDENTDN